MKVFAALMLCATGCCAQVTVTVNPAVTYQTIHNWYALAMNGPGPNGAGIVAADPAWITFEGQFWSVLVQQLGINTLSIVAQSGDIENTQDYYTPNVIGNGSNSAFAAKRFSPVNDNTDPTVFNCSDALLISCPTTFPMGQIDFQMESQWTGPSGMKATVEAAGRKPHLSLIWVTNGTTSDFTTTSPSEAAEHIAAIFIHCQNKYGEAPDTLNIQNEPDLKTTWTPAALGATAAAVKTRLNILGFSPVIECCSTNTYTDAVTWYSGVKAAAGSGVINVLSAHNYGGTDAQMQAVAAAAAADGISNTMNENDGGNITDLFNLLLNAHTSGYMRYTAGDYSARHDGCPYIQVDSTVPFSYHYTIGNENTAACVNGPVYFYPQVMHYVQEGAVMEEATTNNGAWYAVAFNGPGNQGQIVSVETFTTGSQTLNVAGLPAGTYSCTWTTGQSAIMTPCGPDQTITTGGKLTTTQTLPPTPYPQQGNTTAVFTFFPSSSTTATQSQTITFGPLSAVTFGVAPLTLTATSNAGLTVSFASTTPAVCTVSGTALTIVGGGTCSITATQAGSAAVAAAIPVVQSFNVAAAVGAPAVFPGGITPLYSSSTTIQPGSWISIYGTNLATTTALWNGDFPTTLGGVSVTIDGHLGYLLSVSSGLINLQAPDDTTTGVVSVTLTNPRGSWTSTVTLGPFSPSFMLLDNTHVAGIILRADGSGAYAGGAYDIIGPTGTTFGYPYPAVAAKAGDIVELFGVGFGPTNPAVPAGKPLSVSTTPLTAYTVELAIGGTAVTPLGAALSATGVYQVNVIIPAGLGTGDLPLTATVGGIQTQPSVVISLR